MLQAGNMGSWGLEEEVWRKGPWTAVEDKLLIEYVELHGEGRWNNVSRVAGLRRNGKSCRLRWVNYLRPDLKRGQITPQEESVILELHARWGNRWSKIARSLPGRTDNEIKNYWRTHFKKKKGNDSSKDPEKSRVRFLRRQQFKLQQQQLRYQQNQMDIGKKIMTLVDDDDESDNNKLLVPAALENSYQCCAPDEQGFVYPMINGSATFPEPSSNEYMIMWEDGLWNLDDILFGNVTERASYYHNIPASNLSGSLD